MGADKLYKKISEVDGVLDILCIGELLTDYLSQEDKPLKDVKLFQKFLGGSPANIVVHFHNLGLHPALITKIGNDADGKFLLDALKKFEVKATHVKISKNRQTSKSMIGKKVGIGETPDFEIIRGADANLKKTDIDISLIKKAKIIHTNAFSLAENPTRETLMWILEEASKLGKIISFDPNFRKKVWNKKDEALTVLKKIYKNVDLTKPSIDDAEALFGKLTPEEYIKKYHELGANIVVLTMGSNGSLISDNDNIIEIPVEQCDTVDATGAGDLYWSAFLKGLLEHKSLKLCGKMASYASTKAVMTKGAILESEEYEQMNSYMMMFE